LKHNKQLEACFIINLLLSLVKILYKFMLKKTHAKINFSAAARLAGVSRSALSIIINKKEGVSDKTRLKVESILAKIGYKAAPISKRRGVRKVLLTKFMKVGILIIGFHSREQMKEHAKVFWSAIVSAENEISLNQGEAVLIFLPYPERISEDILKLKCNGYIGIGLMPEPKNWPSVLIKYFNPVVWMPCSAGLGWGDAVGINQETTGTLAADYLYNLGSRNAAVVGLLNTRPIRTRTDSFVLRFQQLGGSVVPMRPLSSFYTRSRTPDLFAVDIVVDDLFKIKKKTDGIFVSSDCFLPEVYTDLRRNNCEPGKDVYVIGCSNEREYFRNLTPTPATIDIRSEEIAKRAVMQLMWRKLHPEGERFAIILEPKLIIPNKYA
jgi:DNA-binding LacI/PurR family transcriptional regulator